MNWTKRSRLTSAWDVGNAATNAWQFLADAHISEALAREGFDIVTIDMQHGFAGRADVLGMVRAIELSGATPFVRLPSADPDLIGWLLDAGVVGLICPTVNSAAQAKAFSDAAYYPPDGARSHGPIRAQATIEGSYDDTYQDNIELFAMIETVAGLEAVSDIAAIAGITGLFIGPGDLGISLGIGEGQNRSEPQIVEAIEQVKAAARGKRLGIHATDPTYAAKMASHGFDLVTVTSDLGALHEATTSDFARYQR
jgi:4-hydroxy-2-oxoheptanedioate aldolase